MIRHAFASAADWVLSAADKVAAWSCLALVLLTVQQVFARYALGEGSIALQELQLHLFAAVFLLGAAGTLLSDEHVRVDIMYARFPPKVRAAINCVGLALFLIPMAALMIWYGCDFVAQALAFPNPNPPDLYTARYFSADSVLYEIVAPAESFLRGTLLQGEISANPGGLEGRWLPKALIPLGASLVLLAGLRRFGQSAREALGR